MERAYETSMTEDALDTLRDWEEEVAASQASTSSLHRNRQRASWKSGRRGPPQVHPKPDIARRHSKS